MQPGARLLPNGQHEGLVLDLQLAQPPQRVGQRLRRVDGQAGNEVIPLLGWAEHP